MRSATSRWAKGLLPILGLVSLFWFLLRVIPKPSRASYPCMRVAFPLASTFVVWLAGLGVSVFLARKARKVIRESRFVLAAVLGIAAVAVAWVSFNGIAIQTIYTGGVPSVRAEPSPDPVNDPIGEPKGCNPGRVVWVHDPAATDWAGPGSGGSCWDPRHTDQAVVDLMMSKAIRWLAGKSTDAEAWDALFRYTNLQRGSGDRGYQGGERIVVKLNLTLCHVSNSTNPPNRSIRPQYLGKAGMTNPQPVLALLRQLVNIVGVRQDEISVGDPVNYFPQQWYDYLAPEFPDVRYLDHYPFTGRTQVQFSNDPLFWSTTDADGKVQDYLPQSYVEADYLINFAVLKSHERAGITLCAKNHYGSLIRSPVGDLWGHHYNYYDQHTNLPEELPGRNRYRNLVDLMGHDQIRLKTLLYLVDGLYGGKSWDGTPYKWNMTPFNGDWPSSLFASQDPVAIDSVGYDFLLAEWPQEVSIGAGGAQDYLHEAALAHDPPSGTFYDPEGDGTAMASLGVHEHWNNPVDKQYSRNLGTAAGIELITEDPLISSPNPDIKANGSDDPIYLNSGETLSITIELDPGIYTGYQADWWAVADTPFGWYFYNGITKKWLPRFKVSYQGPLIEVSPQLEVLNISDLPAGSYTFYFGVDLDRNGNLDKAYFYYDSVDVSIKAP